ncbi:hypothetical protein LP422_22085 [Janibacter limosus]|nr:hypothetical protein LP422_22085 [Janibacter limosus]
MTSAFSPQLFLQLRQGAGAELGVARPPPFVEGTAGRGDRALDVVGACVRRLTRDLFGGGIDVVVLASARGGDEIAVDQHLLPLDVH